MTVANSKKFLYNTIAYHLLKTLNFDPRDNAVFEPHWNAEGLMYYVIANREDHSNCMFKFYPENLDIDWS